MDINLTIPFNSYLLGLLQTDGHMHEQSRNRGKINIELNSRDAYILYLIKDRLPVNSVISTRERDTNFKKKYSSTCLSIYDLEFRKAMYNLGLPCGNKSEIITIPQHPYSEVDYWRGIIDGDGSIGITSNNIPFISLITSSDQLAKEYKAYIYSVLNKSIGTTKNKRDGVYNIILYNEEAQKISNLLYYPGCISIPRKYINYLKVKWWQRPSEKRKKTKKTWSHEEDCQLLELGVDEMLKLSNRSKSSLYMRWNRLHGKFRTREAT